MIDFHTHILPNIDDGSSSVEETFNMLKEAREAGFETIISTSHYMEDYYEVNVAEREVWINAILENLNKENINLKLYLGNEIYITENIIKLLETKKATTINNTRYLLFELPFNTKPLNMYDFIYDVLEFKLIPVLAHPERYSFIQKEPGIICDLIKQGVLMQSNYGSIIGQYGEGAKVIIKKLLKNDMVHFLGSDAHRQNSIYPKIPKILNELNDLIGAEKVEKITTVNPRLVLENKDIDIDEPKEISLSLKEKLIVNFKS